MLVDVSRGACCGQALFTTYGFECPLLVGTAQMAIVAVVCLLAARPRLEWKLARMIMPLAFVNVLNLASGLIGNAQSWPLSILASLQSVSIAMIVIYVQGCGDRVHLITIDSWLASVRNDQP